MSVSWRVSLSCFLLFSPNHCCVRCPQTKSSCVKFLSAAELRSSREFSCFTPAARRGHPPIIARVHAVRASIPSLLPRGCCMCHHVSLQPPAPSAPPRYLSPSRARLTRAMRHAYSSKLTQLPPCLPTFSWTIASRRWSSSEGGWEAATCTPFWSKNRETTSGLAPSPTLTRSCWAKASPKYVIVDVWPS